ncbi:MAG: ubiquinone/menaquinone biosynthesis methyltransferase [Terriglobia bacterium]
MKVPPTHTPLPGTRPEGIASEAAAADAVRRMFAAIVPRYDFLNHLLSFGLDRRWRRRTAEALRKRLSRPDARVIDLCTGTGDLALELAQVTPGRVLGSDFCQPMLTRAKEKASAGRLRIPVIAADTLALPFADASFDAAAAAFGFRNLANYRRGLEEIRRILKPGGVVAILEFALPERGLFRPLYRVYFRCVLPWVGNWLAGVEGPYDYLPASVEKFPACDEFAAWMRAAGFAEVRYRRWTGGAVALHLGTKPPG